MRKLTDPYKKNLLEQSIKFYYESCIKVNTIPILVGEQMSKVGGMFVYLRNIKGKEEKVRHTSTWLFVYINDKEYSKPINKAIKKQPDPAGCRYQLNFKQCKTKPSK